MSDHMTVLVTGGAGYIGSHMVLALLDAGHQPVILMIFQLAMNSWCQMAFRCFTARWLMRGWWEICNSHEIDAVAHFAASIVVPESVSDPLKYYLNNNASTTLIAACRAGIKRFVFSSTRRSGNQEHNPINEDTSTQPENPYGTTN